jgi:gliding motility-associated-like protein
VSKQDNINKFDEFFKSNFEEFEPVLPADAWDNIDRRLPSKPGRKYVGFWILGLAGISAALLFNYTNFTGKSSSSDTADISVHSNAGNNPATVSSSENNFASTGTNTADNSIPVPENNSFEVGSPAESGPTPYTTELTSPVTGKPAASPSEQARAASAKDKQIAAEQKQKTPNGKQPGKPASENGGSQPDANSFNPDPNELFSINGNQLPKLTEPEKNLSGLPAASKKPTAHIKDASFALIDTVVCAGRQVRFMNLSNDRFTRFGWDFGDNSSSTEKSPSHAYKAEGTYTVVLKATAGEEVKTFSRKIYIKKVKAFFTADIEAMPKCSFINLSLGADKYFWDFGDGNINLVEKSPAHTYNSLKSEHTVRLVALNSRGCSDTFSLKVVNDDLADMENKPLLGNFFSPNGDGYNDRFEIRISDEIYYHLIVYDRDGAKVFESFDKNDTWNGDRMGSGAHCPNGVYFYFFNYQVENNSPVRTKGSVTLTR